MSAIKQKARPATPASAKSNQLVTAPGAPWRLYVVALLAAIFALLEVYGPALHGGWFLDDDALPYRLPRFADSPFTAWIAGVRPVLMASFWLNFQQAGNEDTYPYHLVNLLLHFLNGVLVYLVIRKLLQWAGSVKRINSEILAIFGAGLFLLHTLQTESVSYIVSRSETLSVFFALISFVVFLYRRKNKITFPAAIVVIALL